MRSFAIKSTRDDTRQSPCKYLGGRRAANKSSIYRQSVSQTHKRTIGSGCRTTRQMERPFSKPPHGRMLLDRVRILGRKTVDMMPGNHTGDPPQPHPRGFHWGHGHRHIPKDSNRRPVRGFCRVRTWDRSTTTTAASLSAVPSTCPPPDWTYPMPAKSTLRRAPSRYTTPVLCMDRR